MIKTEIQESGTGRVILKLGASVRRSSDLRPVLNFDVADYLMEITEDQFNSQGRRAGGAWKPLTPAWKARKAKHGLDPRILHMKHPLRRSVTVRGAPGQILRATKQSLQFGSNLEYAAVHQLGGGKNIPARPFLKTLPQDRDEIAWMIDRHIMEPWTQAAPTTTVTGIPAFGGGTMVRGARGRFVGVSR